MLCEARRDWIWATNYEDLDQDSASRPANADVGRPTRAERSWTAEDDEECFRFNGWEEVITTVVRKRGWVNSADRGASRSVLWFARAQLAGAER